MELRLRSWCFYLFGFLGSRTNTVLQKGAWGFGDVAGENSVVISWVQILSPEKILGEGEVIAVSKGRKSPPLLPSVISAEEQRPTAVQWCRL